MHQLHCPVSSVVAVAFWKLSERSSLQLGIARVDSSGCVELARGDDGVCSDNACERISRLCAPDINRAASRSLRVCGQESRIGGGSAAVVGWQRQKWEAAGGRVAGATTGSLDVGCESALPAATCHCVSGRLVVRAESVKLKLRCLSDLCNFTSGHSRCQAMR
jgi:hypothetical protein